MLLNAVQEQIQLRAAAPASALSTHNMDAATMLLLASAILHQTRPPATTTLPALPCLPPASHLGNQALTLVLTALLQSTRTPSRNNM
jgi:hypothetical protein